MCTIQRATLTRSWLFLTMARWRKSLLTRCLRLFPMTGPAGGPRSTTEDGAEELPPFDLDSDAEPEPAGAGLSRWVPDTEPAPRPVYQLPSTLLLKSPPAASVYDPEELQEIAPRDLRQVRRVRRQGIGKANQPRAGRNDV